MAGAQASIFHAALRKDQSLEADQIVPEGWLLRTKYPGNRSADRPGCRSKGTGGSGGVEVLRSWLRILYLRLLLSMPASHGMRPMLGLGTKRRRACRGP